MLVPMILFLFLIIGAAVFVVCAALPPLRRFALSSALWCAMWGPSIAGLIVLAGSALVAGVSLAQHNGVSNFHLPPLSHSIGWTLALCVVLAIAVLASFIAWLHQAAIHRLTFALFRLYAAVVSAGLGSVVGIWLAWWLIGRQIEFAPVLALACIVALTIGFGMAAFRGARSLRGNPPTAFTWITEEEFNGI